MQTNRYRISNPNTATVNVATAQRAADYLFSFRNSPDFDQYRVLDIESGKIYKAQNSDSFNAIELFEVTA